MSTYYYLICEDHKEITDAVSRNSGGYCPLCYSDKTLLPFIIAHHNCTIKIVNEHQEEACSKIYREWTAETVEKEIEKARHDGRWK